VPLPQPADYFLDDLENPTLIAQGDTHSVADTTAQENTNPPTKEHSVHETQQPHEPESPKPAEALRPAPALDAVLSGESLLREGYQGDAVAEVQRLLDLDTTDGIFSADLAAQIAKFQEDEGIEPSGIVDQLTLQLLQQVALERSETETETEKTETEIEEESSAPKSKRPAFNLDVEVKQGFPQAPSADQEPDEQPTEEEQSTDENQDNPLKQLARTINEGEIGFAQGYGTSTLPPIDPAATEWFNQQHNNTAFNTGKILGDLTAQAQAALGMAAGLIDMIGGGGEAALASPTVVGAIPGLASVAVGAGMVAQGFGAFGRASTNLANDLQKLFNPIDIGGGSSPTKPKKVKTKDLPEPPKGHEWYERKDGKIESRAKAPEGYEWYKSKSGNNHVRRKPGNPELAELEYNFKTHTFEVKDETPDFKAKQIGEEVEIDVSGLKLFDEQLTIRGKAMVRRDELEALKQEQVLSEAEAQELKDAIQTVQDSSEAMGEIGTRHFMKTKYPHYERIEVPNSSGGAKQDRFDEIYKDPGPPPEYIVVENKGGDGSFSTRKVGEDGDLNAQQCTPEYNKSIIEEMEIRGEAEAKGLRKALKDKRLRTFKSQTPIKNGSGKGPHTTAPALKVEKLKVSEYDMKESIKVDKTPKSANPQAPGS
jgi:peptidoglycan hydrolase-like protein with peptidoglycan-binding domain